MDYNAIVQGLTDSSIINLMTTLGANRYIDRENCIIFPTICHNVDANDASMKLYYYKNSHMFQCYTNCESMSIFKFLKQYYETRNIEYDWYEDIYQVVINHSNFKQFDGIRTEPYHSLKEKYAVGAKYKQLPEYNQGVMDCFIKGYYAPEWLNDGISPKAMDRFDIRYSISQNKIVIPHYDADGRLVGIRGRALNAYEAEMFGKYMPIQIEGVWYKHPLGLNLYGLYQNQDAIKKTKICYLFESEKAVMQMDGFEGANCGVAVCGSNFNKYQLNLLLKYCAPTEIVICFDKEEKPGEEKYFNKLYKLGQKYSNYCNFSFIYDREGLLELKDSPTDKGEEVFRKLVERRVMVR